MNNDYDRVQAHNKDYFQNRITTAEIDIQIQYQEIPTDYSIMPNYAVKMKYDEIERTNSQMKEQTTPEDHSN